MSKSFSRGDDAPGCFGERHDVRFGTVICTFHLRTAADGQAADRHNDSGHVTISVPYFLLRAHVKLTVTHRNRTSSGSAAVASVPEGIQDGT